MINRQIISQLKSKYSSYPVLAILGPRQVGKTTLVKEFASTLSKEAIYLDLEKPSHLQLLENPEHYFNFHTDQCLILDEIQNRPQIFPVMRSTIDEHRVPLRFIILGSGSPGLLRQSSESLTGRMASVELTPFTLTEVGSNDITSLARHHFIGGFPLAWTTPSIEQAQLWLDYYVEGYITRDLRLLGLNVSPPLLRKFWEMLAWMNGGLLNYSAIAKSLGLTHPTIIQYLDFFEQAYLVKRIYPYSINARKRLVKSPKIYIADTGILHRLLRINDYDQLLGFPGAGFSWECYVINQIFSLKNSDIDIYFYRTYNGAEVDLLLTKGLRPVSCIEIKWSDAPKITKGFDYCTDDLQTANNFIITPQSEDYQVRHHTRVCSLRTFLARYLPKI